MISIVFPAYNEEENVEELHRRIQEATGVSPWRNGRFVLAKRESEDATPVRVRRVHFPDFEVI